MNLGKFESLNVSSSVNPWLPTCHASDGDGARAARVEDARDVLGRGRAAPHPREDVAEHGQAEQHLQDEGGREGMGGRQAGKSGGEEGREGGGVPVARTDAAMLAMTAPGWTWPVMLMLMNSPKGNTPGNSTIIHHPDHPVSQPASQGGTMLVEG